MSRHRKALIFLTALLAATLSYASFASAKTNNITVLTYTARQVEFHFVDIAPTGGPPSLGDTIVFSNDLYQGGRKVGFDGGTCTAVRIQHHPAAFHCVAAAHLSDGDRTVHGFTLNQPINTYAITGGTKRWRNAGGQVVVRTINQTTLKITAYVSDLSE